MVRPKIKPLSILIGVAIALLALGACSSSDDEPTAPGVVPTAMPAEQPAAAATAMPAATAMAASTAIPLSTSIPEATQPPAGEVKFGGTARMGNRTDPPRGFDVMRSASISLKGITQSVHGNGHLWRPCRDNVYAVCPGLAESWEPNADFSVWTFQIRNGVTWHDGTPFTAADAKWWLELFVYGTEGRSPGRDGAGFEPLDRVEVLDGNRLRVVLKQSVPGYLDQTNWHGPNIFHPRHLMQPEIDGGNPNVTPIQVDLVATGPFKLNKYTKGSVARVVRFGNYWEKDELGRRLPYMDGIDFAIIPDYSNMVAAFRTGRLDATVRGAGFYLLFEDIQRIKATMGEDKVWFGFVGGNHKDYIPNILREGSPFQDLRIRKAVSLWLDRQEGIDLVRGDRSLGTVRSLWEPAGPWSPPDFMTWPGYNPDTKQADRAEARRLMADAGFANGFETNLICRNVNVEWCVWFAGHLAPLGIDMKIDSVDTSTSEDKGCSGDYDVLTQTNTDTRAPEAFSRDLLRPEENACTAYYHADPKLDQFAATIRAGSGGTFEGRLKVAQELDEYMTRDQVLHWMTFTDNNVIAFRSYVKGVIVAIEGPQNNMAFATTWLDK